MFSGAVNAFTGEAGTGTTRSRASSAVPFAKIARHYKAEGLRWVVVGDENYGEGSSREHAAMSPRLLGAARGARAQLRAHPRDQSEEAGRAAAHVREPVRLRPGRETTASASAGLAQLAPGAPLRAVLHHADGREDEFAVRHTFNAEQIEWFRAGSALNLLRERSRKARASGRVHDVPRTLVIVNPHAAGGAARRRWRALEPRVREALGAVEIEHTRGARDAERLAREARARGDRADRGGGRRRHGRRGGVGPAARAARQLCGARAAADGHGLRPRRARSAFRATPTARSP